MLTILTTEFCILTTVFRIKCAKKKVHTGSGVWNLMKKRSLFALTLAVSLFNSCTPKFVHVAQQSCVEATALKNICTTLKENARERVTADSLYNQGATFIRTGYYEKAYLLLNRVIVKYRLILLKHAIAGKEREIDFMKRELAKEHKELSECRKIIDKLTPAERQP